MQSLAHLQILAKVNCLWNPNSPTDFANHFVLKVMVKLSGIVRLRTFVRRIQGRSSAVNFNVGRVLSVSLAIMFHE